MKAKYYFKKSFLTLFILLLSIRFFNAQSLSFNSSFYNFQLNKHLAKKSKTFISGLNLNANQPIEIEENDVDEDDYKFFNKLFDNSFTHKTFNHYKFFQHLSHKKSKEKISFLITRKNPINIVNCVFLI